jgi:tetratricopeptide (TPR) repeat protein
VKVFRAIHEIAPTHEGATQALGKDVIAPDASAKAYQSSYEAEAAGKFADELGALDGVSENARATYAFNLRCGWLNYLDARHEKSVGLYTTAVRLSPAAVQPLLGKLLPEAMMGKWDDLAKTAEAALRLDPRNYTARDYPGDLAVRSGLGWSQLKLDKKADAAKEVKAILQVYPAHELAKKGLDAAQASKPGEE